MVPRLRRLYTVSRQAFQDPDRVFGLVLGSVLVAVGTMMSLRPAVSGAVLLVSVLVILVSLAAPSRLAALRAIWERVAALLSFVTTRIVLTLVFAVVVTPTAVLFRYFSSPIDKGPRETYWRRRAPEEFAPGRLDRQF